MTDSAGIEAAVRESPKDLAMEGPDGCRTVRILYHHRTQGRGVEAVHIMNVVNGLRERGAAVAIVSPPGADPQHEEAVGDAQPGGGSGPWRLLARYLPQVFFEMLEVGYNLAAWFRIRAAVRRFGPVDVYYERYALFLFAGTLMMRRRGVPAVLEVNDSAHLKRVRPILNQRLAAWLEAVVFRRADALIVVTEAFKRILASHGTAPDKIVVIQNTARTDWFRPDVDGGAVRRALGLENKLVVGFVGKAVPWHGVDQLLFACRDLVTDLPELRILIVGGTAGHPALHEIADQPDLRGRVIFTGQIPHGQAPAHIAAMDIAVMPDSNDFGSPVKLFEYMAMARAIIAPRLAPVEEILTHGSEAILVDPGDTAELRASLGTLLADEQARRRMGAAAHARFLRDFSPQANQAKTWETLDRARQD